MLLAATIIFLFIVLPFWLLYRRSFAPPAPEAFGPPPASAVAEPEPKRPPADPLAPKPPDSDEDDEKPVRFK